MSGILQLSFVLGLILMTYMQASVRSTPTNKVHLKRAMRYNRPPMIKMMRRKIRVLEHGERASITLVFYTTRHTYVRWFHRELDPSINLDGSEIPGYFPIAGDKNYEMRYLVAGGVVAATLYIPKYNKSQLKETFATIITTSDGKLQYNLKTSIDNTIQKRVSSITDDINGPEWDWLPDEVEFEEGGTLEIGCQVFVPDELVKKTSTDMMMSNELWFNRVIGKLPLNETTNILKVHSDADPMKYTNWTEQTKNDPKVVTGYRKPLTKLGHVLYESKLTTNNATADLEGFYQCIMERWDGMLHYEKSYAIGQATIKGHPSPYQGSSTRSVDIIVKPCGKPMHIQHKNRFSPKVRLLNITAGRKTCVRCIAMGYPRPVVDLTRQGHSLKSRSDVTAVESINVADAGVSEVTYIFHDPTPSLEDDYRCEALTSDGIYFTNFTIKVVQP